MAFINTPQGKLYYKPVNIYLGIKQIDRDIAFNNLRTVVKVLQAANIRVSPAYGTLLGIIRENNFIEWDEDIDMFILKEEKDKLLNALWKLKEEGFELVRVDRCDYLYSIMRNSEYIDFYIMENISPEVRTSFGEHFVLDRFLTDLREWDFRGLTINVPKDYEECLEFIYGDWRTPVKYANFNQSKWQILKLKLRTWLKSRLPYSIRFDLQKKHHIPEFQKFISKCDKRGIKLNFPIQYP